MPLHPVIAAALASTAGVPAYYELPIAEARARVKMGFPARQNPITVGAVRDLSIPGPAGPIAARAYTPPGQGPYPMLVFFHGSGFVMMDIDTHDDVCRRLCVGADCVVVSIDYRLAPEHRFPAAPDDCLAATRWLATNAHEFSADSRRLAVAGDSAGACLAAVTTIRIRDEGGPPLAAQLLFYPVTDFPSETPDSYREFGTGYGLTQAGMQWFREHYLPDGASARHPHASPLRAATLSHLPPAYVLVAEFDVLRDEGEAFARRLQADGVATVSRRGVSLNHAFLSYAGMIEDVDIVLQQACDWLREILHRQATTARN